MVSEMAVPGREKVVRISVSLLSYVGEFVCSCTCLRVVREFVTT